MKTNSNEENCTGDIENGARRLVENFVLSRYNHR